MKERRINIETLMMIFHDKKKKKKKIFSYKFDREENRVLFVSIIYNLIIEHSSILLVQIKDIERILDY